MNDSLRRLYEREKEKAKMAYGGVISLKQTIQHLLDSSEFSLDSTTREILGFAYTQATSLQRVLERLDARSGGGGGKRLDCVDGQIREAVHAFEDFLELHQPDLFIDENLLLDSEQLRQEVRRFVETAEKLEEDYVAESDKSTPEEEDVIASSSTTGFGLEMVGFSDELTSMKYHVTSAVRPDDWGVLSIVGRVGTGRSYMARSVFDEVGKCRELSFDCGVWVTIGPNYQCKRILELMLTQIIIIQNGGGGGGEGRAIMLQCGEEIAKLHLRSRLVGQKYMVVLDSVCDTQILDYLSIVFPVQNNGSVVLMTTAAMEIALYAKPYCVYRMDDVHINYVDIYWDIFRWVLFRLRPVSPELEEAGRKIVRNCEGLHISMSKALLFLWNADRTPQAWNQIANNQHHPVFQVVDELSEMLNMKEELANLTVEPASDKAILSPFLEDNGISRDIEFTMKKLFPERFLPKLEVISFVGMAGIGKTTFVKKIFEYLQNFDQFDPFVCVWVPLGPKYQSEDILTDILAQIFPVTDKMEIKRDEELVNDLIRQNKRFLIVLDDVWNEAPLLKLTNLFPNIKGRALLTTRLAKVAQSEKIDIVREMRLLNKEESWDLLRQKVFNEGLCPHELEKAGKKIAENCDGLPLTIVKVSNLLSKDLSLQYWNDVANKNLDFTNALKELSNALLPSYKSLPHYLKPCFLYMGVFPQDHEVSTSNVLQFWIAEGFLEPNLSQGIEDFAAQCLSELVNRSLVMVCQKGSSDGVKTCRLNSVFWHLANTEAVKNKFFLALNTSSYDSIEAGKNQRRFCFRNCILLSIDDIHDLLMESISTARSLLCTGPYHQYPLPLCYELSLLRVLDTLAIRFYEFPIEVVKLTHLRHLAITCNGQLPTSIRKLWNLQILIVRHHLRIIPFGDSSYLPIEIWDMKELRHLQVTGCNLPLPTSGSILPNLVTLLEVSSHCLIEEVIKGIPNLKRLGIQIELAPDDDYDAKPFQYLNHISNLSKLESLKCKVINPELGFGVVEPPAPLSMFPSSLEKLSLSGLGYTWEYMDIIGKLENLKVLKLRCYAFQGHEWETGDYAFKKLRHLVIEDTDVVCWKTTIFSFSKLKHLSIKNCYKLEELPYHFVRNDVIEVVDCNPYAVNWAKQMRERNGFRALPMAMETDLKTHVESSWDVGRRHSERKTLYERFLSQVDIS